MENMKFRLLGVFMKCILYYFDISLIEVLLHHPLKPNDIFNPKRFQ